MLVDVKCTEHESSASNRQSSIKWPNKLRKGLTPTVVEAAKVTEVRPPNERKTHPRQEGHVLRLYRKSFPIL